MNISTVALHHMPTHSYNTSTVAHAGTLVNINTVAHADTFMKTSTVAHDDTLMNTAL